MAIPRGSTDRGSIGGDFGRLALKDAISFFKCDNALAVPVFAGLNPNLINLAAVAGESGLIACGGAFPCKDSRDWFVFASTSGSNKRRKLQRRMMYPRGNLLRYINLLGGTETVGRQVFAWRDPNKENTKRKTQTEQHLATIGNVSWTLWQALAKTWARP